MNMEETDMEASENNSISVLCYEEVSWDNEDFSLLCRELDSYLVSAD